MIHVYPTRPVVDHAHVEPFDVQVVEPLPECWLCREGICTQRMERHPDGDDLVVHGTGEGN